MPDHTRSKGCQNLCYNIKQWKIKGDFGILNDISENASLCQLMDTVINVNQEVSIYGN